MMNVLLACLHARQCLHLHRAALVALTFMLSASPDINAGCPIWMAWDIFVRTCISPS